MECQHLLFINTCTVDFYNNALGSILDVLDEPVRARMVTFSWSALWFTSKLQRMKAAGRVSERRHKSSGLTVHRLATKNTRGPTQSPSKRHGHGSSLSSSKNILEIPSSFFSPSITFSNLRPPHSQE
ncbi:hypothetical protein F2P79_025107%2C partial [Xyrichtys novacula]|uniref:Uncharacterized protein n=1 Tax=Xyrichtys novacula TaxID=13765 RepID=A0AAV1GCB2_XYRNO|nr:hypothetical protein F2P79_025107%2C partial [Xyrichtys novacula]